MLPPPATISSPTQRRASIGPADETFSTTRAVIRHRGFHLTEMPSRIYKIIPKVVIIFSQVSAMRQCSNKDSNRRASRSCSFSTAPTSFCLGMSTAQHAGRKLHVSVAEGRVKSGTLTRFWTCLALYKKKRWFPEASTSPRCPRDACPQNMSRTRHPPYNLR